MKELVQQYLIYQVMVIMVDVMILNGHGGLLDLVEPCFLMLMQIVMLVYQMMKA